MSGTAGSPALAELSGTSEYHASAKRVEISAIAGSRGWLASYDRAVVDVLSPPVLTDGVVRLRRWDFTDIACVEAASTDPRIPEGTTVPAVYSAGEARAFIERQWSRADAGEGLSLAVAEEVSDRAIGLISLMHRPQPSSASGIGSSQGVEASA